jgi:hypothetical protein
MDRKFFVLLVFAGAALIYSCNNNGEHKMLKDNLGQNRILQQKDGTISLKVDNAACYSDNMNPSINTAEWSVVVSKSGRFNVWLSSATKDTTNLQYQNSVLLTFQDNTLEARPTCDKIIHNSTEVSYPYFRADSFLGSLYIQDTGMYNVQVISDKILPKEYKTQGSSAKSNTKLLSIVLTPATH